MKGPVSQTILPDGTASEQGEREVGQANTKGFFASYVLAFLAIQTSSDAFRNAYYSLRKRMPEDHDHHVAESTSAGVGQLGCESGA